MQTDDVGSQHDDVDDGSLFGSPPPSPGRGRSSSPLALPSGISSTQNVGTLALPGSHLFSELPSAHTPVSNLTCPPNTTQSHQTLATQHQFALQRCTTAPPSSSRARASNSRSNSSTPAPSIRPTRAPRKKKSSTVSRSAPPPISLPDPSDPPPANFLRNQQSLLGLAGLVSGVSAASLSEQRNARGSTPNNPIVIDDNHEPPKIGRRPALGAYPMVPLPQSSAGSMDTAKLPMPTGQEIFQTLIKQKNIFPVVDALLRLVARTSENQPVYPQYYNPTPSGFQRPASAAPPLKRRKLSDVPAGAADWDVPYPFAAGQGPIDYRTNWERQRGKQLIEDLVGLVKSAARKAAAKNFYRSMVQPQAPLASYKHYGARVLSGQYGQVLEQPSGGPTGSETPTALNTMPNTPAGSSHIDQTYLENFLASILSTGASKPNDATSTTPAASPSASSSPDVTTPPTTATTTNDSIASTSAASSTPSAYPPDFDNFLALFNDLPPNDLSQLFTTTESGASTSIPESPHSSMTMDRSDVSAHSIAVDGTAHPVVTTGSSSNCSTSGDMSSASSTSQRSIPPDSVIDPALFALDMNIDPTLISLDSSLFNFNFSAAVDASSSSSEKPQQNQHHPLNPLQVQTSAPPSTMGTGAPSTPTLVGSPLSHTHTDPDPLTPCWDCPFPDVEIVSAGGEVSGGVGSGGGGGGDNGEDDMGIMGGGGNGEDGTDEDKGAIQEKGKGKGKGKEVMKDTSESSQETMSSHFGLYPSTQDIDNSSPMEGQESARSLNVQSIDAMECENTPASSVTPAAWSNIPGPSGPSSSSYQYTSPYPTPPSIPHQPQRPTQPPSFHITPLFVAPPQPPPTLPLPLRKNRYSYLHPNNVLPTNRAGTSKSKEEILKGARAMRAQLAQEIERAKVELWETAMEGGCLVVLGKEKGLGEVVDLGREKRKGKEKEKEKEKV